MVQSASITEAITTMKQAQEKLGVFRSESDLFFPEWFDHVPELSEIEQERIEQLKRKCIYQLENGKLKEETVKMLVLSPLLDLAGFYDPPFRFTTETPTRFELDDGNAILQGRIDALVFQEQFWVVVVEAKGTSVNEEFAVPQTLAYMTANPYPERPVFGMITNGINFVFLKLFQREYDLSDIFSLLSRRQNTVNDVLQILKCFGNLTMNHQA